MRKKRKSNIGKIIVFIIVVIIISREVKEHPDSAD